MDELQMYADDLLGGEEAYLEHHGIKGMKWGDMNGPPYPLSRGNLNSAEKKNYPDGSNDQQKSLLKKADDFVRRATGQAPRGSAEDKRSKALKESQKRAKKLSKMSADELAKAKIDETGKHGYKTKEIQKAADNLAKQKEAKDKLSDTLDKVSTDEKYSKRQKELYSMSPEEMLEHQLDYSKDDVDDYIEYYKNRYALQDVASQEAKKANEAAEERYKKFDRMQKYAQSAVNLGSAAIDAYNIVQVITGGDTIKNPTKGNDKKDDKKDDNNDKQKQQQQQQKQDQKQQKQQQKQQQQQQNNSDKLATKLAIIKADTDIDVALLSNQNNYSNAQTASQATAMANQMKKEYEKYLK